MEIVNILDLRLIISRCIIRVAEMLELRLGKLGSANRMDSLVKKSSWIWNSV